MKKFLTKICAAAVLLCSIVFTGCGVANAVVDYLSGTYNQWYKYNSTVEIPLGNSTEDEVSAVADRTLQAVEIYVRFIPSEGLKVALQASKEQNVSLYNELISTNLRVTMGGIKDYSTSQFNSASWAGLMATGKFSQSAAPKVFTNPDECIMLDQNTFKIQWKKVLANYLLDMLLR